MTDPSIVEEPRLVIIAGPNGSGKTTLTNRLRAMGLDFGEYINADEIALQMPSGPERDRDAQKEADRRRSVALSERRSFSFETVMSHSSKIEEMRKAKAAGYHITFIGIALQNPHLNVQRVALRVAQGGHDVPTDRIIARYTRTLALMPMAIAIADRSLVFDNSDSDLGPILVLSADNWVKHDGNLTVRVSKTVNGHPDHWVMRRLVEGLNALEADQGIALHFGPAIQD